MIKIKPVIVDNVAANAPAKTKDITQFGKFAISGVKSDSASGFIDNSLILFSYFKNEIFEKKEDPADNKFDFFSCFDKVSVYYG